MVSLLLPVIYLAFISLGLPDSLLGSAWPVMYQELGTSVSAAGIISMIISAGTIVSSLNGHPNLHLSQILLTISDSKKAPFTVWFKLSVHKFVYCFFYILFIEQAVAH